MKKIILCVLLSLYSLLSHSIYFKHIGVKDGLSQLSVLSIHQDKLGRIWFGTMEGLSVYNGVDILSYKGDNAQPRFSIEGDKITNITENKDGDIFFMTNDNGIMSYDLKHHKFSKFEGLQVSALSSIDGTIYIASKDTIYTWDEATNGFQFKLAPILGDKITKIFKDHQQQYWIGTVNGLYKLAPDFTPELIVPNKEIWEIFESSQNELWIGTRLQGMYKIDDKGIITEFRHNPNIENTISSDQVRTFVEDSAGNIWIGTFVGLNKYNPTTGIFTKHINDYISGSLSHSSIFSLLIDKQGSFWIGLYYGGVNFFNPKKDVFTYYGADPLRDNCLNYPFVGNMVEDNEGNVWICTEGGGLNMLNRKTNRFKYYVANSGSNGPNHNNLKSISYDSIQSKLYIGTHTGGVCSYDMATQKFKNYLNEPSSEDLTHAIILQTIFYKGYLYFQDNHGLFKADIKTGQITPLFPSSSLGKYSTGSTFIIDSKGYLWLSTLRNYLVRFNLNDPTDEIKEYYFEEKFTTARSLSLLEASNGDIYVTTLGLGLLRFDRQKETFTAYTAEKGQLLSNYCYNVAESKLGHLITIGDKGISILDPQKGLLKSINISQLLPISSFNRGNAILVCKNGEILVSTTEGLISFFEEDLFSTDPPYNLYFSNLYVNNTEVLPNDGSNIIGDILAYTEKISLKHSENNLTIIFADNDYASSYNSHLYEYMLEGLDKEWISTNKTSLVYTHLNPGTYILKVRSKDIYNTTNNKFDEIKLEIVVHAPFYATTFAWILYMLLFGSLLYAFIYFRQRRIRLEASLRYERKEKIYITNLNKSKLSFFTKISHEFRTPLTLIITQIELLLQSNMLSKSLSDKIESIYKNSHRMRNLVNEILDLQKMEDVKTHLKIYDADLVPFLEDIYSSFKEKAQQKEIRYHFDSSTNGLHCWFDPEQLQKVFYNLLSNAFSYTPREGRIDLIVIEEKNKIVVKVIDNGIGIEKIDLEKIFDPFYQASNNVKVEDPYLTTGMGLAICKEIVDLHHGTITVESKPDYGSIFIVTFQKGATHFENDNNAKIIRDGYESVKRNTIPQIEFHKNDLSGEDEIAEQVLAKPYTILIVEDNEELSELLATIFAPYYNVMLAYNGKEGLEKTADNMPDIVLSDIMMPEMDGTELCLRIKNNINTSHIPVVLLTARTSDEQNLEGLKKGADDYIVKPFNAQILLTRCNNLIQNRLRQQENFRQQDTIDIQLLANNEVDQTFLKKVESVIDANINNQEFDINTLAREIAMGRSSLFTKFKTLTGISPNEFILNYKLKKAAFMLRNNPDLQINEVADEFGFSSGRYFSRCFKLQFNMTPNEYRKKTDNN